MKQQPQTFEENSFFLWLSNNVINFGHGIRDSLNFSVIYYHLSIPSVKEEFKEIFTINLVSLGILCFISFILEYNKHYIPFFIYFMMQATVFVVLGVFIWLVSMLTTISVSEIDASIIAHENEQKILQKNFSSPQLHQIQNQEKERTIRKSMRRTSSTASMINMTKMGDDETLLNLWTKVKRKIDKIAIIINKEAFRLMIVIFYLLQK